jgi:hypothetical protein
MAENTDPPLGELTLGGDSLRESKDDIPTEKPSEPKSQQVKAALKNLSLHFDLRASQEVEVGEIDEDEEPIKKLITGCYLPKGFLPQGRKLTPEEREKIRTTKYDPSKRKYVERDVPLTQEELECWDYQSRFALCKFCSLGQKSPRDIDTLTCTVTRYAFFSLVLDSALFVGSEIFLLFQLALLPCDWQPLA